MITCTWKDCQSEGTTPQVAKDGQQWGCLCQPHASELDQAVDMTAADWTPKRMMRAWVLAQGGAKAAAERMR